jgi:phosphopantetheinyl transferase
VRSLAADKMLSVLCRQWGVPPHQYDQAGRPSCGTGAHLTASHDGDFVVAGISDRAVGVDVTDCRRRTGWVARILSDDERDVSADGPEGASEASRLGRAWAVREAALKWAGVGLGVDPRTLAVVRAAGDGVFCGDSGAGLVPSWSVGQTWWRVVFPDGGTVTVAAGTIGTDHALALAVEPPVTVRCCVCPVAEGPG